VLVNQPKVQVGAFVCLCSPVRNLLVLLGQSCHPDACEHHADVLLFSAFAEARAQDKQVVGFSLPFWQRQGQLSRMQGQGEQKWLLCTLTSSCSDCLPNTMAAALPDL
jgi:hypothetical protein